MSPSRLQTDIALPERLQCRYPNATGRLSTYRIVVHAVGENAHGICFLIGAVLPEKEDESAAGAMMPAAAVAFRIDRINGAVTRLADGESMSIHLWEHRVRQRFAIDRDTDALPLSSMLISDEVRAGRQKRRRMGERHPASAAV